MALSCDMSVPSQVGFKCATECVFKHCRLYRECRCLSTRNDVSDGAALDDLCPVLVCCQLIRDVGAIERAVLGVAHGQNQDLVLVLDEDAIAPT
jgi:hypothetical protein